MGQSTSDHQSLRGSAPVAGAEDCGLPAFPIPRYRDTHMAARTPQCVLFENSTILKPTDKFYGFFSCANLWKSSA